MDDARAAVYLRAAVYKEAKRVRRDLEMPDRVWFTERDPKTKKKVELPPPVLQPEYRLEFMVQRSETPEFVVIGSPDARVQVLEMLYAEGSQNDRRIVGMLHEGLNLPEIAEVVGWPEVQRFQRKARRWIRIKL
jgi:hypothetical protein